MCGWGWASTVGCASALRPLGLGNAAPLSPPSLSVRVCSSASLSLSVYISPSAPVAVSVCLCHVVCVCACECATDSETRVKKRRAGGSSKTPDLLTRPQHGNVLARDDAPHHPIEHKRSQHRHATCRLCLCRAVVCVPNLPAPLTSRLASLDPHARQPEHFGIAEQVGEREVGAAAEASSGSGKRLAQPPLHVGTSRRVRLCCNPCQAGTARAAAAAG